MLSAVFYHLIQIDYCPCVAPHNPMDFSKSYTAHYGGNGAKLLTIKSLFPPYSAETKMTLTLDYYYKASTRSVD